MTALGSTFKTSEPALSELLAEIEVGTVQLPDFQRPWVWEDHRIRALIASVSLAYPLGAVMLMEVGEDTRFAPRPVEGTSLKAPAPAPKKLILDGQQRLTSLFCALKSGKPVKTKTDKQQEIIRWYYWDMKRALGEGADHQDRVEAVVAVPEDKKVKTNFDRDVALDVSTTALEHQSHMFPMSLLFDAVRTDQWLDGYVELHGYSKETNVFVSKFRREIRDAFHLYRVPVIELLTGTRKEAVCQVFENVNTGGVALTVFELITATFASDDFRLRPEWDERQQKGLPERKLAAFKSHDVIKRVGGETFVQAVTLYSTYLQSKAGNGAVGAKRKDMLRLTLDDYRATADNVHRGFLDAARLLMREKVFTGRNLPYAGQLVPLAAVMAALGERAEDDAVKKKLARWYWCGVFGELYGSASESRFANDVQQVPAWIAGGDEPRTIRDANFTPTRLLSMQSRQSAAYKGTMALLMGKGSLDLKSGDPIHITNAMDDDVDIHHLFPADHCEKRGYDKHLWNSVVNKAPLTAKTNRSIGGRAPSVYLAPIDKNLGAERVNEILASHGVDSKLMRSDDFAGFARARTTAILDLIEGAIGKSIAGRDSEETVTAFGGKV